MYETALRRGFCIFILIVRGRPRSPAKIPIKRRGSPVNNIILIGMPGSGKSTIGVILAKELGYHFTDTDILIQQREERLLQDIVDRDGVEALLDAEERAILGFSGRRTVVATGGSAVFRAASMAHLGDGGVIVYLRLPLAEISRRIRNFSTRGIACKKGTSLTDIYEERTPLYERYAEITVDCAGKSVEENADAIIAALGMRR